jgi:hypothetical protein
LGGFLKSLQQGAAPGANFFVDCTLCTNDSEEPLSCLSGASKTRISNGLYATFKKLKVVLLFFSLCLLSLIFEGEFYVTTDWFSFAFAVSAQEFQRYGICRRARCRCAESTRRSVQPHTLFEQQEEGWAGLREGEILNVFFFFQGASSCSADHLGCGALCSALEGRMQGLFVCLVLLLSQKLKGCDIGVELCQMPDAQGQDWNL